MIQLRELTEPGRRQVERTLEEGNRVTSIDEETIREYSVPIHDLSADIEGLREELESIVNADEPEEYSHHIDAEAAPIVRGYIDITRRQAARDGLWHWLAVSEFPEFVYHRWRETGDIEEKFLAAGTDIYSNAIHRLWWGAELTRDGSDYERTERMFSQGELANDVLDRWFARYRPAAKTVVDQLDGDNSDTISDLTRDIRNELSSYTLEMMSEEGVEDLIERLRREM
jgi:hypothetical protein